MNDVLTYIGLARQYEATKKTKKKSASGMSIAVVTNFTDDILVKTLTGLCLAENITPNVRAVPYKQYLFELKDSKSELAQQKADITFIFFDVSPYKTSEFLADPDHVADVLNDISRFCRNRKGLAILNTIALSSAVQHRQLFSGNQLDSAARLYREGIQTLAKECANVFVVETDRLMQAMGEQQARDLRGLYAFDQPFSNQFILALAKNWMGYIRALSGKARKCIVVDLDNTMWGGIVGETGPQGITLGPDYPGSAFQHFQRILLQYYEQGIILAINSRNNPEDVDEVFASNPHMILKKYHFASIVANWNTKAENLRLIAKELNIGLDAMVFFDDDPMNRDLVRTQLPEVLVPEFSVPPEEYSRILLDLDAFHSLRLTDEDKERGRMYAVERERKQLQAETSNPEEYLAKLGIQVHVSCNDMALLPRVAQLTQKTNQFNLTTYRSTEQEIGEWIKAGALVYTGDVHDMFGAYGVTILAVLRPTGVTSKSPPKSKSKKTAGLEIFLMSCRIMGRQIERVFFREIMKDAARRGFKTLSARFIPTKKNMPAKDFLPSLGAKKAPRTTQYSLDIPKYLIRTKGEPSPVQII